MNFYFILFYYLLNVRFLDIPQRFKHPARFIRALDVFFFTWPFVHLSPENPSPGRSARVGPAADVPPPYDPLRSSAPAAASLPSPNRTPRLMTSRLGTWQITQREDSSGDSVPEAFSSAFLFFFLPSFPGSEEGFGLHFSVLNKNQSNQPNTETKKTPKRFFFLRQEADAWHPVFNESLDEWTEKKLSTWFSFIHHNPGIPEVPRRHLLL